jgi:hypothetical protein
MRTRSKLDRRKSQRRIGEKSDDELLEYYDNSFIPNDPYVAELKFKRMITYTLQLLVSVLIALEVSMPPNPYKTHLIVVLTSLIAIKYNLVSRIESSMSRLMNRIKLLIKR